MKAPAVALYPYQKKWLLDKSRFKIAMFARQTGKTFTSTLELVDDCFAHEAQGLRTRWVILSRGERQAKEAIEEGVRPHAEAYNLGIETLSDDFRGEDGTRYKQLEVVFPGGSRIIALPANPDTARGFSANVFLDEFAFHADSRKIWSALFPVISKGWKMRITSTPNGKGNRFYELMTGGHLAHIWSRHTVDIYQAVEDGLPRDIPALKTALDDDDAWAQEYELQWLDEASAWLPFDLINSCEHEQAGSPEGYAGGYAYVGVDIGRRSDLFVIWVVEKIGDVCWTREVITRQRASFAEQDVLLDEVMAKYKVVRVCMDQTGMGEKPVEDARARHGDSRIEGVLFSGDSKQNMAIVAKQAFEDRRLRIPLGDDKIRFDLHKIKKTTGPSGAPRFVADRDSDGHADRAWALFLALSAAHDGSGEFEYFSGATRQQSSQEYVNELNI